MPFRFRKIISLGKGFRFNISKGGISSSIGRPGATLNISKRGARPTLGIPGSGLSYTPSLATNARSNKASNNLAVNLVTLLISGFLICLISICCIGVLFIPSTDSNPTPSPKAEMDVENIIALTAKAAISQTYAVASPVATETQLDTSTFTPIPQPTLAPTWTPFPTDTPFVMPVFTYPVNDQSGQCVCNQDIYNCGDPLADTCFSACNAQGAGDIHRLDQNNNGIACEDN